MHYVLSVRDEKGEMHPVWIWNTDCNASSVMLIILSSCHGTEHVVI